MVCYWTGTARAQLGLCSSLLLLSPPLVGRAESGGSCGLLGLEAAYLLGHVSAQLVAWLEAS